MWTPLVNSLLRVIRCLAVRREERGVNEGEHFWARCYAVASAGLDSDRVMIPPVR